MQQNRGCTVYSDQNMYARPTVVEIPQPIGKVYKGSKNILEKRDNNNQEQIEELKNLKQQLSELQKNNSSLKQKNFELKKQNKQLKKENQQLKEQKGQSKVKRLLKLFIKN